VRITDGVARVVLESRLPQLDRLFDYAIPHSLDIQPGMRVKVPLRSGNRTATGLVVEVVSESSHQGRLAEISERVSEVPLLTPELWQLARAVADRQAGSAADVLRLAIPQRYVRQEKLWRAEKSLATAAVTPPQRLPGFPEDRLTETLATGSRFLLSPPGGVVVGENGQPRPRAADVVAGLAHRVLGRGESSVVVVPDWRDIEHYHQALRGVIPEESLVVSHGDMPGSARYLSYLRGLSNTPLVVLGNRHAVYHPRLAAGLDGAGGGRR
jgi:primosomal protein N' (replication factor Y) (superfamily II helicase)